MLNAPVPGNEVQRLQLLRDMCILDTPAEERLDVLVYFCQSRFGVDYCLVSLVDQDRQWFKASAGLRVAQTGRRESFCGHTVFLERPLVVKDAALDERFADNPLVTGPPHIRFYAGVPLRYRGACVGTLCLLHGQPRPLAREDLAALEEVAEAVSWYLEHERGQPRPAAVPRAVPEATPAAAAPEADPWAALAAYVVAHPNTLEARMLRQVALSRQLPGGVRAPKEWEQMALDPRAVEIARAVRDALRAEPEPG